MSAAQRDDPDNAPSPRQTLAAIRKAIREEPELWLQRDARNRWFCPHCAETVNAIVLPPGATLALMPDLQRQIMEHLQICAAVKAGIPAQKRLRGGGDAALSGLHQSMHDARLRQRHTLRRPPKLPGYEIGCLFRPMDAVGGDFYEFIEIPGGRLGIGIGDASGHGVEACMLSAVTKKLLSLFGRTGQGPRDCLCAVNREIHEDVMQGVFISAEYAILNADERTLVSARAGHPPPIVFNPKRDPAVVYLNSNGLALGVDRGRRFDQVIEARSLQLESGDLLILYTDGLIELNTPAGEEIGIEGFVDVLKKHYDKPVEELIDQVWYRAEKLFRGSKQPDDVTMVAIKVVS